MLKSDSISLKRKYDYPVIHRKLVPAFIFSFLEVINILSYIILSYLISYSQTEESKATRRIVELRSKKSKRSKMQQTTYVNSKSQVFYLCNIFSIILFTFII